ncbi:MAG TPA: sigma-70 family RNA polymerase sigma factor [Polyangia bacterium]|jgi:RNA polymerase sigma-70 factor (ECF subfamily)
MIERASFSRVGVTAVGGDAALVAAIAAGDRDALATLYDAYAPLLFALAKRILGNVATAEDLIHDVFLEVWHHAAEYSAARGSVPAWLTVRTRSRALDRLGKSSRDARAVERATTEQPEATPASAPATIDGARVRQMAMALPDELTAVLDLAYFEGLSSSEIAARLQTPIGTVKSRMARALALLREAMRPGEGGLK